MMTDPENTKPDDGYPAHWRTAHTDREPSPPAPDDTDSYPSHWATARDQQQEN